MIAAFESTNNLKKEKLPRYLKFRLIVGMIKKVATGVFVIYVKGMDLRVTSFLATDPLHQLQEIRRRFPYALLPNPRLVKDKSLDDDCHDFRQGNHLLPHSLNPYLQRQ